jgi:hypothetical protein
MRGADSVEGEVLEEVFGGGGFSAEGTLLVLLKPLSDGGLVEAVAAAGEDHGGTHQHCIEGGLPWVIGQSSSSGTSFSPFASGPFPSLISFSCSSLRISSISSCSLRFLISSYCILLAFIISSFSARCISSYSLRLRRSTSCRSLFTLNSSYCLFIIIISFFTISFYLIARYST